MMLNSIHFNIHTKKKGRNILSICLYKDKIALDENQGTEKQWAAY